MYLHKEGCEYYHAIMESGAIKGEQLLASNSETPNYRFKELGLVNIQEKLIELSEHIKKIFVEIESEENVLKQFANKVDEAMNTKITDPKKIQLIRIIEKFRELEQEFRELNRGVNQCIKLLDIDQKSGQEIVNGYKFISATLKEIHNISTNIAEEFKVLIRTIKTEEQLIKKEEEVVMSFDKNLMSWF